MLFRLEQQELAKQKEREFEELRKTWAISSEKRGGGGGKKKKQQTKRDSENEEETNAEEGSDQKTFRFSDSESEKEDPKRLDDADVFGSSDDEEPKLAKNDGPSSEKVELFDSDEEILEESGGNLRKKRPAQDLEDDQDETMFSAPRDSEAPQKQRRVVDDDDDELEAEADF